MNISLRIAKGFTLLFLLLSNFCFAQKGAEIFFEVLGSMANDIDLVPTLPCEFHDGFIVINSDTINGTFRFSGKRIYCEDVTGKTRYKLKEVTVVRLFSADPLISTNTYTDFVHVDKPRPGMYRKIHSGSFEIYDRTHYTNEIPGYIGDVVVTDAGKIMPFGSGFPTQTRYLVNCINEKFCLNKEPRQFNGKIDVIRWLKLYDKPLNY